MENIFAEYPCHSSVCQVTTTHQILGLTVHPRECYNFIFFSIRRHTGVTNTPPRWIPILAQTQSSDGIMIGYNKGSQLIKSRLLYRWCWCVLNTWVWGTGRPASVNRDGLPQPYSVRITVPRSSVWLLARYLHHIS